MKPAEEANLSASIAAWWRDKNIRTEAELAELLNGNSVLFAFHTRRYQLGERPGTFKHHDFATGKHEIGAPPGG